MNVYWLRHWRYWNTNGMAIAIVAAVVEGTDWAAYIGATTNCEREEAAVEWAVAYGAKLSEAHARFLFPDIELPYRP